MAQVKALSSSIKPYLMEIARLRFVEAKSLHAIETSLQRSYGEAVTRTDVINAIEYLKAHDLVSIHVSPDHTDKTEQNRQIPKLQLQLIDEFNLKHCDLVPGILDSEQNLMGSSDRPATRVLMELGEVGSKYLTQELQKKLRKPSCTICVGAGNAVNQAISHIDLQINPCGIPNIVPFTGFLGWRRSGWAPLANARLLERILGGSFLYWFGAPALIPESSEYDMNTLKEQVESLPMIRRVNELRQNADVYIISVASEPKIEDWLSEERNLVTSELKSVYEARRKRHPKPIGAISAVTFDQEGEALKDLPWVSLGGTLEELRKAVANDKEVVLIAGGEPARVRGIKALLKSKTANVLITDVHSARQLLLTS